jgi:sodium transport system ATP-binding protein
MIEIDHLAKKFVVPGNGLRRLMGRDAESAVHAVRDVNFHATDGRMLAGLTAPDSGRIAVDGIDAIARPRDALARLGLLSDARGLYPRLTARENLVYYGRLHGMPEDIAHQRVDLLAGLLEMKPLLERRTGGFSQGELMKTALARALIHDPPNIVLDEPTNGLDVIATRALREALRFFSTPEGGGKCIVFSTHILSEVERLCDHIAVISQGCTVAKGTVGQLRARTGSADFEDAFVDLAFGRPHVSLELAA